ncbi:major facilitator superfamily domain-containing protein [Lipomyces japonicus]|uniref:major facilitator superfamily domain-containing protein n=1 Tax=Lipomyces japonicus TaxID=56871 RepID=UPI0034CF61B0
MTCLDIEKEALAKKIFNVEADEDTVKGYGSIPSTYDDEEEGLVIKETEFDIKRPYVGIGHLQDFIDEGSSAWTAEEENRVRLKTDFRIMIWASIMFFSLQINRITIVNAVSTNFLSDINVQPDDYNLGQTVFVTFFLIFEIPTQIMNTTLGPENWIPIIMTLWGIVGLTQTFITSKASYLITRAFLGVCMGGFVSGLVTHVSSFYKSDEMSVRLSMLWTMNFFSNVVAALLASAIFKLDGRGGWHNWQWFFFIIGILSIMIGVATKFLMISFKKPHLSRLYSVREQDILRARVILDDPSKGKQLYPKSLNSRTNRFTWQDIFQTVTDKYLLIMFIFGWLGYVPSVASYLFHTVLFRDLQFDTTLANLLTIPGNVLVVISMIIASRYADKYKTRWYIPIFAMIFLLPFLILLIALPDSASRWIRVVCITFVVGFPYYTPVMMSWVSANANDQKRRALSLAIYNISVQFGNITSVNIYRENDAPYYRKGNAILIGILVFIILFSFSIKWYYVRENARRDKVWNDMTEEEREDYTLHTTDMANARLDFRLKI